MARFDLEAFFNNLEGKTWSLGSAFKRADALPIDLYSVWENKTDAENYALTHPTAYPGQILIVVEAEGEGEGEAAVEKIKLYYIDENKDLQEVGSATLGDDETIVLDPATKTLSIKGFENAGYVASQDETPVENKVYYVLADGIYSAVEEIAEDAKPVELGYYERVAVKVIKDANGDLAWVTDDAVQIQGNIAALQTTVEGHTTAIGTKGEGEVDSTGLYLYAEQKAAEAEAAAKNYTDGKIETVNGEIERIDGEIDAVEKAIEDLENKHDEEIENVNDRITSLGTVFNFVGSLSVLDFAATTDGGEDNLIDSDAVTPGENGRPYRPGDVVLVDGKQEYVVVATEAGLVWEAFGDPTGVAGIEGRLTTAEGKIKTIEETTIPGLESDIADIVGVIGVEEDEDGEPTGLYEHIHFAIEDAIIANNEEQVSPLYEEIDTINNTTIPGAIETAKGYADGLLEEAKGYVGDEVIKLDDKYDKYLNGEDGNGGLKARIAQNEADIADIQGEIDTASTGIKARLTNLENGKADKTEVQQVSNSLTVLEGNVYSKTEVNNILADYETKTVVSGINERLGIAEGTIISQGSAISGLQSAVGTNTGDITDLKTAKETQAAAIQTLQTGLETTNGNVTKAQTDATQGINDAATAKGIAEQGVADAADALAAAQAAQSTANDADALSKENAAKFADYTTTEDLNKEFAKYSTTTEMNTAIAAVVSNGNDTKADDTVKGAKLYTDDKVNTVNETIKDIKDQLVDLTTVMNFVGVFEELPETDNYAKGDVCIVGSQEYVLVEISSEGTVVKDWEPFGTVTADEARFEAIEGDIDTLEGKVDILEDAINDTEDEEGNTIKGIASRLTDVEGVAAAAATQTALAAEIERATQSENAIELAVQEGFAAQATKNTEIDNAIDAIINATTGLLSWGSF